MRILIAVPTYETIMPDTFKSIYNLDKGGHEVDFDFVRGYDVSSARNRIAKRAKEGGYDYVLMVDNDMIIPQDALVNLLSHNVDVCMGYYLHRGHSNVPDGKTNVCRLGEFNFTDQIHGKELAEMAERGDYLMMIHGGGMGCCLIRTSVFDRFKYPWYKWTCYPNGNVLSEDLYFCVQCGKAHIGIYTDTRVGCAHCMRHFYWPTEGE